MPLRLPLPDAGRRHTLARCDAARRLQTRDLAALRPLLDAGVSVDTRDAQGRTALLAATHADRIDAARLLVERGADVNAKDEMQDSPYLLAGAQGRLAVTPLAHAKQRGQRTIVEILRRAGARA